LADKPSTTGERFRSITACETAGKRSVQFWGIDYRNQISTIFRDAPTSAWSGWLGREDFGIGGPSQFTSVCVAQLENFRVQLWALDQKQQLWSICESYQRGTWEKWEGPNWNNAPRLNFICGCQHTGNRSASLWGIDQDYNLISCYQSKFGKPWSKWAPSGVPDKTKFVYLTAAQQNDGRVQLWGLDMALQLWSCWELLGGGNWTEWHGPNWEGAPKLLAIAAAKQSGNRGAAIWAIDRDYKLISNYQETPGGNWNRWYLKDWNEPFGATKIAAASDSKGVVHLWAVSQIGFLSRKSQLGPGSDWKPWEVLAGSSYVPPDAPH